MLWLAACAPAPHPVPTQVQAPPPPAVHHLDDPDVNRPRDRPLLAIDWTTPHDPLELWAMIAPTGDDWEAKLEQVPETAADGLALALLAGGNFACATPAAPCNGAPADLPDPAPTAGFGDPCLRRLLALWSIAELDADLLPKDALRTIAALPPPESQLVATAIRAVPEADQDFRLELLAIAWHAGQREIVAAILPDLDEPHVVEALTKHHIDSALDSLTADRHRAEFLAAVGDTTLAAATRIAAIDELATGDTIATGKEALAPDVHKALVAATRSPDCAVAAFAAHVFELRGDHHFGPKRPPTRKVAPMMRALCVLAHYERLQQVDEPSYLLGYVPAAGLELVRVTYDPYGDPPTAQTREQIKRDEVVLPELEDLLRAVDHCADTVCTSEEHEFHFGFKPGPGGDLLLTRIDVVERPLCGIIKP